MLSKRKILVVDDLDDNRRLLGELLEESGYLVSEARDGQQALEAIQADRPDLVLLDLLMPIMDGFGVLAALKQQHGTFLPVIVVTALVDQEVRLRALALGAHEFLAKPIDRTELLVRVGVMIELKIAKELLEQKNRALAATVVVQTRALGVAEQQLALTFKHAAIGIAIIEDDQGFAVRVNPALERMTGYLSDELRARPIWSFGRPEDQAENQLLLTELFAGLRESFRIGGQLIQHDGEPLWINSTVTLSRDEEGQPSLAIALIEDVSERFERESLQADRILRMEAAELYKDEFLSVMSHELRTPLNFIMGFASTLEDEVQGPINPAQRHALGKIMNGSDHMLRLVEDLLEVATIQADGLTLYPEPTAYAVLVASVLAALQPLAAKKDLRLAMQIDATCNLVLDPARITQVLTNLVGNAIKFTGPGGQITVQTRLAAGEVVTEVTDTGMGIDPADREKLFKRFSQVNMSKTRSVGGTGLGLAIAKGLVEAHGGSIDYVSRLGEGSTFFFTLPIVADRVNLDPRPALSLGDVEIA